jgi:hypothetical protein
MIRKLLLVAIVLLLIGAAGLFLFARSVLSPDSVRATLEQQLSSRLGQAVRIGSARAAIFPRVALELGDVTIGAAAQININRITIATGLRGLLNRRVEDAEVVLSGGRLALPAVLALVPSSSQSAPGEPGTGFTVASVRVISLRDVTIVAGSTSFQVDLESALEGDRLDVSRLSARSGGRRLKAASPVTNSPILPRRSTRYPRTSPCRASGWASSAARSVGLSISTPPAPRLGSRCAEKSPGSTSASWPRARVRPAASRDGLPPRSP